MEDTDIAIRLALISAERLHQMANSQTSKELMLAEMNALQYRLGMAIQKMEADTYWIPSGNILPEKL